MRLRSVLMRKTRGVAKSDTPEGCAFDQGKELCGEAFLPKIVEQVSAGGEDVSIIITEGMVVILELYKAVYSSVKRQEVNAVQFCKCVRNLPAP